MLRQWVMVIFQTLFFCVIKQSIYKFICSFCGQRKSGGGIYAKKTESIITGLGKIARTKKETTANHCDSFELHAIEYPGPRSGDAAKGQTKNTIKQYKMH